VYLYCKKKPFEIFESDQTFMHEQVLLEQKYPGIGQGLRTKGMDRFMELNLREYRNKEDKKYFSEIFAERDDHYLGEGVQPTVTGRLVKITYSLRLFPEYKTCCACSPPQTDISVFISPPKLPSYKQVEAPQDWDPQVFDVKEMAAPVPKSEKDKLME
jgi:hypothetical protein